MIVILASYITTNAFKQYAYVFIQYARDHNYRIPLDIHIAFEIRIINVHTYIFPCNGIDVCNHRTTYCKYVATNDENYCKLIGIT